MSYPPPPYPPARRPWRAEATERPPGASGESPSPSPPPASTRPGGRGPHEFAPQGFSGDLLHFLPEAVVAFDADRLVLAFNPAAEEMFGFTASEVLGRHVSQLGAWDYPPAVLQPPPHGDRAISPLATEWQYQHGRRKDGSSFPICVTRGDVPRAGGTLSVAVVRDQTAQRARLDNMHQLAFFDELTGLPNRRLLMDRLERARHATLRSGTRAALLFLDIDNFKLVNDVLGHAAGDELLRRAAGRIERCLRGADSAARVGGDEFVVLLGDLSADTGDASQQA